MKLVFQKEGKGRKSTFKDILYEQNEVVPIQLWSLQGKEDQLLLPMKSVLLLLRKPGTSLQDPGYQSQRGDTPVSKATFPIPMITSGKATPLGVTVCQPTLPRLESRKATEHLGPKSMGRRRKHSVFESTSQANVLCHSVSAVLFRKALGKDPGPSV